MKVLGRGWQYTTYDLGNGRVFKKYNSAPLAYVIIFFAFLRWGNPKPWNIPKRHSLCKNDARASFAKIREGILEPWMTGNPKLLDTLDYEQDTLKPLHALFKTITVDEGKKLIDKFVALNTVLLTKRIIDKSFKIGANFGLDREGRVVLMDLGELYSDENIIEERRRKRVWDSPYLVRGIPNKELREYYIEQMDRNFGV
jgi:hypothetical protein